jgi:hypothetical protein
MMGKSQERARDRETHARPLAFTKQFAVDMMSTLWSFFTSALPVLFLASTATPVAAWPSAPPSSPPSSEPSFVQNVTVFAPPADAPSKRVSYGRAVLLNQNCEQEQEHGEPGTILATASFLSPPDGGVYLIIHKSTDYGATWSQLSKAYLTGNASLTASGGLIFQPFLYEIAEPFGKYQPGTILLSANVIPADRSSTNIQLYASTDKG